MDDISIGHIWIDLIQCHELFVLFIDYILLKIPIKFEYSFVFSPEWRHFIWIFVESVFVLVGLNKLNSIHSNRFSAPPKSTSNLFLTMKSLEHDNWFCLLYLQHGFSINKIHAFTFDIVQLIRLKCQTMKLKVIYCSRSSGWVCVFFFVLSSMANQWSFYILFSMTFVFFSCPIHPKINHIYFFFLHFNKLKWSFCYQP